MSQLDGSPWRDPRQPRQKPSRATTGDGLPLTCVGAHGCGEVIEKPSESALQTHYKRGCRGTRFEHRFAVAVVE